MADQSQTSYEIQSAVYDKLFKLAGGMGRAQVLIVSISYFVMLCAGWQVTLPVFAARHVDYICVNNFQNKTSLPNRCYEECSEYVYDRGVSSITRDFDLDCGPKKHYSYFIHSSYWLGYLISNLFVGFLGDRTGRKPTCVISLGIYTIVLLGTLFCPNIELLLITRFITGFSNGGSYSLAYLIAVECTGEEYLTKVALLSQIVYGFGGVVAACMGYVFIASWRLQISAIAGIITLTFLLSIFCLPESPRWLYSQGKLKKSEKVLKWICELNQNEVSMIIFDKNGLQEGPKFPDISPTEKSKLITDVTQAKKLQQKASVFDLCSKFRPAMLFLTHLCTWAASAFVYFALIFQAQDIGPNLYIYSVIINLCELPTLFLLKSVDKIGHKRTVLWGLLLGSLFCLVLPFIKEAFSNKYVTVGSAIFAKFLVTCSYNCLFLYTPKTFPTVLRSTAMNACFVAQNLVVAIAGVLSQAQFGPYDCGPYVIYGVFGISASLLVAIFGKKTVGIALMNAVEEYNKFAES